MGGSKEEDDLEQKGFRIGVDLHLGAIRSLSKRERERERERGNTITREYKEGKEKVRMN